MEGATLLKIYFWLRICSVACGLRDTRSTSMVRSIKALLTDIDFVSDNLHIVGLIAGQNRPELEKEISRKYMLEENHFGKYQWQPGSFLLESKNGTLEKKSYINST